MLRARVITALLLLAGFLAALFLLPFAGWMALIALVAALAGWEWGGLIGYGRMSRVAFAGSALLLGAALGLVLFDPALGVPRAAAGLAAAFLVAAAFWLLAVPAWLRGRWRVPGGLAGAAVGLLVILPACLALMHLRGIDPLLLLAAMATVWVADIAAFFAGRAWGRRKLAPSISPGKTWEGAAGALAGVLVFGFSTAAADGRLIAAGSAGWLLFALALAILTAVSIEGDLFESMVKRAAGVKDSGRLLPGHGGVLDRIDSLTAALPLVGLAALYLDGRA